jgi:FtsP/CotA-like multicopper oxidase with cupredoxin domain
MPRTLTWLLFLVALAGGTTRADAQNTPADNCLRPPPGTTVPEPADVRSKNGVLTVDLAYQNSADANGSVRYCYVSSDGKEAPNLRVKPGDLLIMHLKNELTEVSPSLAKSAASSVPAAGGAEAHQMLMTNGCTGGEMTSASTNVHFHGLDVPPVCHQDDVLNTIIQPGGRAFEYRFRIPQDQAPGLYWYHPHVHGFTKNQVLGGASGALIVEGIERANTLLAGMPERVFVIRDQDLVNPNAQPVQSGNVPPPIVMRDAEGDILNAGRDGGTPAKDLTINFVPVSFPEYKPAVIRIKPGESQLWRVLNASAITYLDLQLLVNKTPRLVGVASLDGNPINENGLSGNRIIWQSHILLPPAGRVEFVVRGLSAGQSGSLVTRVVDTGPAGENDPTRPLATIVASDDAPEPHARLEAAPTTLDRPTWVWLGDVKPVRTRTLYFSEQPRNPDDPNSLTDFYITVEGQTPKLFDPGSKTPDIVAKQGDVEDWIIENRTRELHAFHIHQVHFMLVEWNGVPLDEPFLRDTINVAYWDGKSRSYPSVKLRMDFRDPNAVGTFVYHCHLLEHEDGGMMGLIRVEPKIQAARSPARLPPANHRLCGSHELVASPNSTPRSQRAVTYWAKTINKNDSKTTVQGKIPAQKSF